MGISEIEVIQIIIHIYLYIHCYVLPLGRTIMVAWCVVTLVQQTQDDKNKTGDSERYCICVTREYAEKLNEWNSNFCPRLFRAQYFSILV
jgi:hypothetical protein